MQHLSSGKLSCACLAAALAACAPAAGEPSLGEVRSVAERYRDVNVAKAEGFTTDNKCVTAEMLGFPKEMGAMGLHYVRRDMLGLPPTPAPPASGRVSGTGTHTDFRKPAMLVYEPQPDGSLVLVAVENLVFASAWHEGLGQREPPKFHGRPYELLEDKPETKVDEAHGWEPHYERHVWVLRDNPNGLYSPFNPKVTCAHHKPAAAPAARAAHPAAHSAAAPAASAAAASRSIDPARAAELVRSGALLVDVRERAELAQSGWLQGAVHRPLSSFTSEARTLPKDRPILLYCASGRRAGMAADLLTAMGFTKVYNLGGFDAAARAGMPVKAR